jgi:crossover junction endodeoxyribonuclease RuvC
MAVERLVLGIDPGSESLGYCALRPGATRAEDVGAIRMKGRLHFRFGWMLDELENLFSRYKMEKRVDVAVEIPLVYGPNNATLVVAGSRGIVLAVIARFNFRFAEYHASKIKKAITGRGDAKKWEVAAVLIRLLGLPADLPLDATDAAGLAYFHANRSAIFEESLE